MRDLSCRNMVTVRLGSAAGNQFKRGVSNMKAVLWLILLLLAAVGVASIVDYFDLYDVPMVEVSKQEAVSE